MTKTTTERVEADLVNKWSIYEIDESWLWRNLATQCLGAYRTAHILGHQDIADLYWMAYEQANARADLYDHRIAAAAAQAAAA